jgi:hypothetical protein
MSDKKISQLVAATIPLAGTEVLPIVQSGATVKVSVDNLTAGRDVSGKKGNFTDSVYAGTNTTAANFIAKVNVPNGGSAFSQFLFGTTTSDSRGYLSYSHATDSLLIGTAGGTQITVGSTGNTTLSTGNLVIGTAGKGIDFSADPNPAGMTSELLDDYEEGTWTPTDASGGGLTFTSASGTYTKIGNTVTLTLSVPFPSNADSNVSFIGGIPFTAVSTAGAGGAITYTDASLNMTVYQSAAGLRIYTTAGGSIQNITLSTKYVEAIIVYRA